MKHILYDMGFNFCRAILEAILNSLKKIAEEKTEEGWVIIGKNILLVYFMFQNL